MSFLVVVAAREIHPIQFASPQITGTPSFPMIKKQRTSGLLVLTDLTSPTHAVYDGLPVETSSNTKVMSPPKRPTLSLAVKQFSQMIDASFPFA